jgi:galactokinase
VADLETPVAAPTALPDGRAMLAAAFPAADDAPDEKVGGVGRARGTMPVQATQTHYSDGYALLLPMHVQTAVAVRASAADHSRLAVHGTDDVWAFDAQRPWNEHATAERPPWLRVATAAATWQLGKRASAARTDAEACDIVLASRVPPVLQDAYAAALGVATVRALARQRANASADASATQEASDPTPDERPLGAGLPDGTLEGLQDVLATALAQPYSAAWLQAAHAGEPPYFLLADTAEAECLPVESPLRDALGWVLIDPQTDAPQSPAAHRARAAEAEEALRRLQQHGFNELNAFRDIEHRDLQRVLSVLPETLRPLARHLVTENRRVAKLVGALRRGDGQMVGALLLMSHASARNHDRSTSAAADFLVDQAEAMTMDACYGAGMTDRSGAVLATGPVQGLRHDLDRLQTAFRGRFGRPFRMMML